jgi:hypothetical protein
MARRAAMSAAGSGDLVLESRTLVTLGGILVHSLRGRDREALGLLRRAQQLAATVRHPELVPMPNARSATWPSRGPLRGRGGGVATVERLGAGAR